MERRPISPFSLTTSTSTATPTTKCYAMRNNDNNNDNKNAVDKGFNLLELSGLFLPKQGVIVKTATETWKFVWKRMMAELAPQDSAGNYQRPKYSFTAATAANELDLTGTSKSGKQRYHLYVGNPCPWCHRTLLAVQWLNLTNSIAVTRLEDNPQKASRGGWIFSSLQPDTIFGGCHDLRELYDTLQPGFQGRCTAPLLVDTVTKQIVSNESADIIRLLNAAARRLRQRLRKQQQEQQRTMAASQNELNQAQDSTVMVAVEEEDSVYDLYPPALATKIDETNDWVYRLINNGVYRCGFATTQSAYMAASNDVIQGLVKCNQVLSMQPYLCGNTFSEADLRLLPTILRFDGAYGPLFKAGGGHVRIRDYAHVQRWLQQCWKTYPAVRTSIDLADACESYYRQLFPLNPGGIVPYPPISAQLLGLEE